MSSSFSNNDVWCAVQRKLSNALLNWDLHRPYTASLAVRTEGFTEEWGYDANHHQNPKNHHQQQQQQDDEWRKKWDEPDNHEVAMETSPQRHPTCRLRLVQFRPAWTEQLVLRVTGTPHLVLNSAYAVTEATGPLPYLQDLDGGTETNTDDGQRPPAMVGRRHAANRLNSDNAIHDFLKQHRGIDLDRTLSDSQRHQSDLFTLLIRDTLCPCLTVLRYQADSAAWEQIYRPQCMVAAAAAGSSSSNQQHYSWLWWWWRKKPLASWQAWSERVQAVSSLTLQQRSQSTDAATATARRVYAVLEDQLVRQLQQTTTKGRSNYLLGTVKPSTVDCLLWDHLMQAVTDIHLVVVLADFPALLQFTQHIWNAYQFGAAVDDNCTIETSLSVWNLEENAANSFNEVPLLSARVVKENEGFRHAIDLMEMLSVVQQDLHKALVLAKKHRRGTDTATTAAQKRQFFATWHRWRMGDSCFPSAKRDGGGVPPDAAAAATGTEELMRREYQRNDEIWMASVAATTLAIILGFGFAGGNSSNRQ